MNVPTKTNTDHRESSDRYRGEIYRLGGWRVAECKDQIQWLIQHHTRRGGPDGGVWESKHYCVTREALLRLWRSFAGADGVELLAMLPERFECWQNNGT